MSVEHITLGQYADDSLTTLQLVEAFLRDAERASHAYIVGATGKAWAAVHGALQELIGLGIVAADSDVSPWEYVWKGK